MKTFPMLVLLSLIVFSEVIGVIIYTTAHPVPNSSAQAPTIIGVSDGKQASFKADSPHEEDPRRLDGHVFIEDQRTKPIRENGLSSFRDSL